MIIINCTPHPIRFLDKLGGIFVVDPSGETLAAKPREEVIRHDRGVEYVMTIFDPTNEGWEAINRIKQDEPNSIIVGSIISAQAYPGKVVSLVPVPGYERKPPDEKLFFSYKFNEFPGP